MVKDIDTELKQRFDNLIKELHGRITWAISSDDHLSEMATVLRSIPWLGPVASTMLIAEMPEIGTITGEEAAALTGLAPLAHDNGTLRGKRVIAGDAREVRAMTLANGIDIVGGNCLGVADSWIRVRIGGALGGDHPEESLLKGSIAVFSNSGGFTTTIAQYMATAGWGTTTLISSGKDVYIQYGARDFAHGLASDPRSRAAVLYVEPGGYYEKDIDWSKPVVACVVGRWKSKLTRAVGHAGATAGSGDSAEDKDRWR